MDDAVKKFDEYVNALWKSRFGGVLNAQRQLLGWLFTVHGAGIAACLGYVASKGISENVTVGLVAFTIGLVLLLIYGALFFYLEVHHFRKYEREVKDLGSGKRSPQQFIATQAEKHNWYRSCEIIGWISGLCALVGLGALIMPVLNAPKTASPAPCPPGRPSDVTAHVMRDEQGVGGKDVELGWMFNPPHTEVGFEVARTELVNGQCQNFVVIMTIPHPHITGTVDYTAEKDKTYCYRIRALGQSGNHSEWSYQVTSR
jgi:hypothetical protein